MGNATVVGAAKPRAGSSNLGAAQLARRHVGDGAEEIRPLDEVAVDDVVASVPWRTFRWYGGQQHYSGTYWAATESDHVIYESRLELARLLFVDFDVGVQRSRAAVFAELLRRRHGTPTYSGLPAADKRWTGDRGCETSSAVGVEDGGVHVRVDQVGVDRAGMAVRGVERAASDRAGECAVPRRLSAGVVVRSGCARRGEKCSAGGVRISEALSAVAAYPEPSVRAALFHLLWRQEFRVDMTQRLTAASVLRIAS